MELTPLGMTQPAAAFSAAQTIPVTAEEPPATPDPADSLTRQETGQSAGADLKKAAAILTREVSKPEELWRSKPATSIYKILAGNEGNLYLSAPTEAIAVSSADGTRKTGYPIGMSCINGLNIEKNDRVYVSTNQGAPDRFVAFDRKTGRELWSKECRNDTFYEQITESTDGTLYTSMTPYGTGRSKDNRLVALNPADGTVKWQFPVGGRIMGKPLLTEHNAVIFPSQDHNLYSLDATTGKKQWAYDAGAEVACSPLRGPDGTIICLNKDGKLAAVDETTGTQKWETNCFRKGQFTSGAPVIGPDGTIFVADPSTESHVMAIDGKTGALLWEDPAEKWIEAPLVVSSEGTLFAADKGEQTISIYQGKSGKKETLKIGEPVTALAYDDRSRTLYTGTSEGSLIAFHQFSPKEREEQEKKMAEADGLLMESDENSVTIDEISIKVNKH